jgi:hypothetical protein
MWSRLHDALARLWRWSRRTRDERPTNEAREHFWAELREGEREAEARVHP